MENNTEQQYQGEEGHGQFPVASLMNISKNDEEKGNTSITLPIESPYANVVATEDYSVFTKRQKRMMIATASFVSWISPLTGAIYYPAVNQIAADLHVTNSKVALTVTTYLIFQDLGPMMIVGFSDKAGRKPAYIACFSIYMIANLALALQNNYIALLLLRMLQAGGSSGTIVLSNGLVGDLIPSSERGKYIAFASIGLILGPSLSPFLGGIISEFWDGIGEKSGADNSRIFWFLLILSGTCFVPLLLFLPETCRNIIGNGSVPPPKSSWNLSDQIRFRNRAKNGIPVDEAKLEALRKNYRITLPNPISTLLILRELEIVMLLFGNGVAMACFYAVSTGAAGGFRGNYGFNELRISLMFLPIGAGGIVSAFTAGYLVDWNYRRHANRLGYPVHKNRQTDLAHFPIEVARMQIAVPHFFLGAAAMVGYGWVLASNVSFGVLIVFLFLIGYTTDVVGQTVMVLCVDINPGKPANVSAANNVVKCLVGAAASAAIVPMSQTIGYGLFLMCQCWGVSWAYTILGVLFLTSSLGPIASMSYGIAWRRAKKERDDRKAEAKRPS
ncbi:bicyclomycin resistance protein, putative [Talaromyces stipitatus ATCC 10500]|uniref:Bicyclomycin resistance protein, putative n=1 Tax=Talaromyces stipitatus (strain ATCC 10500 / CBS 375.48 / QM 6759 / NRRL 1006) TaxID=441959 RepID=B8MAD8_TALSN|nr:bicyclomycin resistance protein, putative [Talaromyces stipitatus ATCC 10500]EED18640.1 bicyclomycin resistance protein, putative [Talaromyces stipitatus ATCC 10500]